MLPIVLLSIVNFVAFYLVGYFALGEGSKFFSAMRSDMGQKEKTKAELKFYWLLIASIFLVVAYQTLLLHFLATRHEEIYHDFFPFYMLSFIGGLGYAYCKHFLWFIKDVLSGLRNKHRSEDDL